MGIQEFKQKLDAIIDAAVALGSWFLFSSLVICTIMKIVSLPAGIGGAVLFFILGGIAQSSLRDKNA